MYISTVIIFWKLCPLLRNNLAISPIFYLSILTKESKVRDLRESLEKWNPKKKNHGSLHSAVVSSWDLYFYQTENRKKQKSKLTIYYVILSRGIKLFREGYSPGLLLWNEGQDRRHRTWKMEHNVWKFTEKEIVKTKFCKSTIN